ncbi:hypothetical protein KsCSTR_45010 [Candidatus Kuenenia stuttgartiensis]|jgi:hypothetical protein|uniref:Uncharacterized protein n=1 Tax=Kuenenia stuttgartiensis TaxID=174633 RepID=Q1PWM0_KUEST|nr:hypothetical protein KsCSTR_45010 [Candidatus Kuenenia stuttgartiensis]TVM01791.1 MAG: hypothetical protein CV080_03365 [Candidatus Kuenenia stuttgartiensis]GJQ49608.1 MAG: hypothetical protein HKUEN01_19940 [Candidatus Kuenenia stuttgartiensis]CAJ71633.1 unknown protein [Candidatus Kuenenia stuttgartiensis]
MSPAGGGAGGGFVFSISYFTIKYFAKKCKEITAKVLKRGAESWIIHVTIQIIVKSLPIRYNAISYLLYTVV